MMIDTKQLRKDLIDPDTTGGELYDIGDWTLDEVEKLYSAINQALVTLPVGNTTRDILEDVLK